MPTSPRWTVTTLGHSCVLIEIPGTAAPVRILLDPGSLSPALDQVGPLDAVLVTHAHVDHVDPDQVRRLRRDAAVPVYGPRAATDALAEAGLDDLHEIADGDQLSIASVEVAARSAPHQAIYDGVPLPDNLAYLIGARLYAPGDSFAPVAGPVDVLLLPLAGPWMKLAETIDYLRAVAPEAAVLVHDAGLADPHRTLHRSVVARFAPDRTRVLALGLNESAEV